MISTDLKKIQKSLQHEQYIGFLKGVIIDSVTKGEYKDVAKFVEELKKYNRDKEMEEWLK